MSPSSGVVLTPDLIKPLIFLSHYFLKHPDLVLVVEYWPKR